MAQKMEKAVDDRSVFLLAQERSHGKPSEVDFSWGEWPQSFLVRGRVVSAIYSMNENIN